MLRKSLERRLVVAIILALTAVYLTHSSVVLAGLKDSRIHKKWPCLRRTELLRDGNGRPVWLSSSELVQRVLARQPIEKPGPLGKNTLKGTVSIEVLINRLGEVSCARGLEGHPIGIEATIRSLRKWTFRPYLVKGKPKAVVGVMIVPYDFT